MNRRQEIRERIKSLLDDIHISDILDSTTMSDHNIADKTLDVEINKRSRNFSEIPTIQIFTPSDKITKRETSPNVVHHSLTIHIEVNTNGTSDNFIDQTCQVIEKNLFYNTTIQADFNALTLDYVMDMFVDETVTGVFGDGSSPKSGAVIVLMCEYREEPYSDGDLDPLQGIDFKIDTTENAVKHVEVSYT